MMQRSQFIKIIITSLLALTNLVSGQALVDPPEAKLTLEGLRGLETQVRKVTTKGMPATVAILNGGGSGSGVVIDKTGLILTAAHVVERSKEVKVVFPDGTEATGKVLGAYYTRDIAMVQITDAGEWPHASLGQSNQLESGEWVVAMGHAKGYDHNRTPPARFARLLQNGKRSFLITDCTLIGGDSGGPLFNLEGEVIGIHSSIGNNLSINNHAPVDAFQENWEELLAGKKWGQLGLNPLADPDSPVLGIEMSMDRRGVLVGRVVENSPASRAGLIRGDLILALNENQIKDAGDLLRELSKHEAGETIQLKIQRESTRIKVPVALMKRSQVFPNP